MLLNKGIFVINLKIKDFRLTKKKILHQMAVRYLLEESSLTGYGRDLTAGDIPEARDKGATGNRAKGKLQNSWKKKGKESGHQR